MPGLASISIDLDGLPHYAALHGLPPEVVTAQTRALVHQVAVPRFAELMEGAGGRGTLFVIRGEVDAGGARCGRGQGGRAGRGPPGAGRARGGPRAREPQPRTRLCAVPRAGRGDR